MWAKYKKIAKLNPTKQGFTIVELLIVIVVIGILAAITIVAYNGIQDRAKASSLQSDLTNAGKQLAIDNINNGTYPSSITLANGGQGLKSSPGTSFQYGSPGATYCLTATNGTLSYVISDAAPSPKPGSCGGLMASYYPNMTLSTPATVQQVESSINYNWNGASPVAGVPGTNFSVQWVGFLTAPTTGSYTFTVTSDDGERLYVNNALLVDKWVDQGPTPWTGTITLTAGQKVPIKYQMYQNAGGSIAKLEWTVPGGAQTLIPGTAMSLN